MEAVIIRGHGVLTVTLALFFFFLASLSSGAKDYIAEGPRELEMEK
jgi:hypothetical protein